MFGSLRHLFFGIALLAAVPMLAAETDPPARVGRVSLASEGTSLRVGDAVAAGVAALNWPVTTGTLIETASGARAEARIGSTALRIDGGTALEFVEVNDARIWLRLNRGSVALNIRNVEHAAEMALDTPQGRLRFDAAGSYRADVTAGTTAFSAYQGTAHIEEIGLTVRAGERIEFLAGHELNYILGQTTSDAFRQWSLAREHLDAGVGTQFVSSEMTGHEELDRHGNWRATHDFGPVWFPRGMPLGWAPYRWGHWAWVSPWGWTWVDHAPWGFAPFHYGRWMLIGGNWAWVPGTYVVRPIYAPALIVWLGKPGWQMSFSIGTAPAVGWFPLGPREIYYPYYRSSLRHVRNINVTHVSNPTRIVAITPTPAEGNRHVHRNRHEAVTVVPEKTVTSGAPVDRSAVVVRDKDAFSSAPIASSPPHFNRTRDRSDREASAAWPEKSRLPSGDAPPVSAMPINSYPPTYRPNTRNEPVPTSPPDGLPSAQVVREAPTQAPLRAGPLPRSAGTAPANQTSSPSRREAAAPAVQATTAIRIDKSATVLHPPPEPYSSAKEPMRPLPRQEEPRSSPSQAHVAVSQTPHRQIPAADLGHDHGTRTTRVQRHNEPVKSKEPEYRERTKLKQGPLAR